MSYLRMLSEQSKGLYFRQKADCLEFRLREIEQRIAHECCRYDRDIELVNILLKKRDDLMNQLQAITPLLTDTYLQAIHESNNINDGL